MYSKSKRIKTRWVKVVFEKMPSFKYNQKWMLEQKKVGPIWWIKVMRDNCIDFLLDLYSYCCANNLSPHIRVTHTCTIKRNLKKKV